MKSLLVFVCASALVLAADSSRYKEDFHYSYPQSAGGRLLVENFNGSVEVTGWDQNTVDVSGTKYAESQDLLRSLRIEASSTGNEVRLKTVRPEVRHGNMGARYVIRVPRRTELERITSSNGSVRVEDIEGSSRLNTSNGSLRLARIRGNIDATSSNGGVEVSGVDGSISLRTSNGSVHAEEVRGGLEAETSNGAIHVHLRDTDTARPIRLSTSNGSVELQLDAPRHNDVVASTSNGGITVRLPAGASAELHAATSSSGTISSDFEILTHGMLSKHRLEGRIGGGGPKYELTTSNGAIRLLRM